MKKQIVKLILVLITVVGISMTAEGVAPKREFRAIWLTTHYGLDWPSVKGTTASVAASQKASMDRYLNNCATQGYTAVFFQVRSLCDAMYKSKFEPWSHILTGTRGAAPAWDPLEYCVQKCHELGLECHAWVNPFRWTVSASVSHSTPNDKMILDNKWLITNKSGSWKSLDPSIPAARNYVTEVIRDIITSYKVDGVIFDDYFYPDGGTPETTAAEDYTRWQSGGSTMSLANWRRSNVNTFVREVYAMIQSERPDCRFGISPAGSACTSASVAASHGIDKCPVSSDWQYATIYADPVQWIKEGVIDYISPQLYWTTTHSTNPFGPMTKWWSYVANKFNRHHFASQNVYFIESATGGNTEPNWAEVVAQIELSRQYTENNAPGCVMYRSAYLNGPSFTGMGDYIYKNAFQTKSLMPVMTWKQKNEYSAPSSLYFNNGSLTWDEQIDGNRVIRYSVYAYPENITDNAARAADGDGYAASYLLGVTYTNSFALPADKRSGYKYAVCVYDGFGNESAAAVCDNSGVEGVTNDGVLTIIAEGSEISLSAIADVVEVYSVNGMQVGHYAGVERVDASNLAKGVYIVKAQKDGVTTTAKIVVR